MAWEACRFIHFGWIRSYYIRPDFLFTYYGFSWVRPWPGDWMYAHVTLLGVLGFFIAIGLFYRVSTVLFFPLFTYLFLLDQANYLNHFYFVSLISFLMMFLPAHRWASVDAWLRPSLRSQTTPFWCLWILKAQLAVVYIGAGVAKINDDFLNGQPMRMWLAERGGDRLLGWHIGEYLTEEWAVWFFSYGGLLFDLFIVPALIWKRTRIFAFVAVLFFHLMNAFLFDIGIFPWFSIAATLLYLPPNWPRRLMRSLRPATMFDTAAHESASPSRRNAVIGFVAIYMLVQILVPLRHFLYPGTVHWTEEGHRFSWHMKLRDKDAEGKFWTLDKATGGRSPVRLRDYLSPRQAGKMLKTPDMILQFAHHLKDEFRKKGRDIEVYAEIMVSLNSREPQLMIDPEVNLADVERTLGHATWILPLNTPAPHNVRPHHHQEMDGDSEEAEP